MRLRALVIVALVAIAMTACGDDDAAVGFSETTRTRYLQGCGTANSEAFCQCTLAELEDRFTEAEYLRFAVDDSAELRDALVEISLACIAEAELGG